MVLRNRSFWTAVYSKLVTRKLGRSELREIVKKGLVASNGNYKVLVANFNMPPEDYERFRAVLRRNKCVVPREWVLTVAASQCE
jgi:hypothetical protein